MQNRKKLSTVSFLLQSTKQEREEKLFCHHRFMQNLKKILHEDIKKEFVYNIKV